MWCIKVIISDADGIPLIIRTYEANILRTVATSYIVIVARLSAACGCVVTKVMRGEPKCKPTTSLMR